MRNTISDMNAYYNTQINTAKMSPNKNIENEDHIRTTQTQPGRHEYNSNVDGDNNSMNMMTPNGMSLHTPNIVNRNSDHQQAAMTTASGMDTMNQTMTPLGDNMQEKTSMKLSQDQFNE